MPTDRASIFGDDVAPPLDVRQFQPKPRPRPPEAATEAVKAVSEANQFPSRQPATPAPAEERLPIRRYRTGRNQQLNLKVSKEAMALFYQLADAHEWVLGEAFEHAVKALAAAQAPRPAGPERHGDSP